MWDQLFSGTTAWFGVPAVVGTVLFAVKLALMFTGGDHHGSADGHDAGADAGGHDADLKLLSIQGVLGFLMGFGWTGLLVLTSTKAELIVALAAALAAGVAVMYGLAKAMRAMMRLQISGNVSPQAAVGAEGVVYVTVPAGGRAGGQVTVVIDQKQRTYAAVSGTGRELARNTRVRVVAVEGRGTLRVEPA